MTANPVQIRKEEVVRDIRELAALKGMPITEVVADAVRGELERIRRTDSVEDRLRAVREIVRRFHEAPALGPPLTDDDLYDEDGFPK